jgi:diguanylate cyclase (GGDEF)-like protein/PAS domain S-box-containing protein
MAMDDSSAKGVGASGSGVAALHALADATLGVDAAGRITQVDPRLAALAARDPAGLPVDDLLPGWSASAVPAATWRGRLARVDGSSVAVVVAALREPGDASSRLFLKLEEPIVDQTGRVPLAGLRDIIDIVPGFLFAKDADGRFLFVNRTVANSFGEEPERVVGRTDADYGAPPEAVARYRAGDLAVLESGRAWTVDKEYLVHADGTYGWYQTTKVPFRDPATGRPAVLGLATDITRRVEAEARLSRESALARILMRLATEFINLPADAVAGATDRALAELGAFVGADRAYVFEYDFERRVGCNTHEWCAEGITPEIEHLGAVPFSLMPAWVDLHRRGEAVVIADVGRHPVAALREHLELQGIRSLVVVPMPGDPEPAGFVGFDAVRERRDFSDDDVALLRVFAEMLADVHGRIAAHRLLERERQRLADIIEGTSAGTWEWDVASGNVRINAQAARMLGYEPDALDPITILTWQGLVHPDDGRAAFELFRQHLAGEIPQFVCETRMRHRDGRWIWVVNRGRISARDPDGRPLAMSGTYQDVTQRREAEQALRESEERFRRLFQDVSSVAVQGFDADFTIRFWNRGSEAVYGYTAEEAIGRSLIDLLVPEADREQVAGDMRRWVYETPSDRAEEFELWRADGRAVTVLSSRTVQHRADGGIEVFCFDVDISDKKANELDLQLAASVFTHSRDGILIADRNGRVIRANAAFGRITGRDPASMVGRSLAELVLGDGDARHAAAWWQDEVREGGDWTGEFPLRRENGTPIVALLGISAVRDGAGRVVHHVGVLTDVTAENEYQAHLERMAHFDALTGLPNRTLLATRLRDAAARARKSRRLVALAYVDLDGFKAINDSHGHDVGDRFLEAVAQRMSQLLGDVDTLARVGGDEFVALVTDLPDRAAAHAPLGRLRDVLGAPFVVGDVAGQLSASIGVAFLEPDDDLDGEQLLRQADQAMYVAKHLGRNRIHYFDADLARAEQARRARLDRLREALARDEFVLHFQPRVDLTTGRVVGCEALLRWQHPERGLLPPDEFLPGLRGEELEVDVGWRVIGDALAALAAWRAGGLAPTLSINVVAEQLLATDFVARLREAIGRHPTLPPRSVVLEILETGVLADVSRVAELIRECAGLGVDFALDDFGTGYSSLAYLKHLPVRQLKIDRSFVRDMLVDRDDLAIIEGVVGLARVFGLEVVAEGVETGEQARALVGLGCPIVQGFLVAPAMPAAEFAGWCRRWRPPPDLLAGAPNA